MSIASISFQIPISRSHTGQRPLIIVTLFVVVYSFNSINQQGVGAYVLERVFVWHDPGNFINLMGVGTRWKQCQVHKAGGWTLKFK